MSDMARPSPHRYYNNLFSFLFCVDAGDFAFDDVKQLLTDSDASHLPNMTVLLNKGLVYYSIREVTQSAGYVRYPNEEADPNREWCFRSGNPAQPGTPAGAHLSTLWGALITHLSDSYLEPPNAASYMESVSVFSRASRQWAND